MADGESHDEQINEIQQLREEMKRSNQKTVMTIIGTGLVMSAFIVFGLDGYAPQTFLGAPIVSWALGGLGAFFLVYSVQD